MPCKKLLIILMLCISGISFSQTEIYTIYLKNGSTYKGTLVEKIPGETITIKTAENEALKLTYDEIQKITTTEAAAETTASDSTQSNSYQKRGFLLHTEAGFMLGVGKVSGLTQKSDNTGFGFRIVFGFQSNETMALGFGLGLDKYANDVLIPVTIDLRATLLKGKTSPTINVNAGYAPNILGVKEGGGFVVNPSIGIKTYLSKKTAFFFNLGYKVQQDKYLYVYYTQGGFGGVKTGTKAFNFVNFTAGFAF